MTSFSVLLKDVLNRCPLLNRLRPQTNQVGEVALCLATAHSGKQNVLTGHTISSGAFEGLAVAGEGHAGVQRFDPALKRSRSRRTV